MKGKRGVGEDNELSKILGYEHLQSFRDHAPKDLLPTTMIESIREMIYTDVFQTMKLRNE